MVPVSLKIDESKVTKKGYLYKRGNIFSGYSTQYVFYLEDSYLKFGKKGKPLTSFIDLRDATVKLNSDSQKKFKIFINGKNKLKLKALSAADRNDWVQAISQISTAATPNGNHLEMEFPYTVDTTSSKRGTTETLPQMHGMKATKENRLSKRSSPKNTVTLNQITDMLQNENSKLNQTM